MCCGFFLASDDADKPEVRIANLLGMHGRPTLPHSPSCSFFPLEQPSGKPGRHPDLDLESSQSGGSVTSVEDLGDNSNSSCSAHSTPSAHVTREQDSFDDFQEPGQTPQASHRKAGRPVACKEILGQEEGVGGNEAVSKGKLKRGRKRKGGFRSSPAVKKQKVDKNQPSLHHFFSRQSRNSSSKAGPSVEKSQEDKDMEMALELQKQFDIEVKYRLTANRFKGAGNEYSLRESRR